MIDQLFELSLPSFYEIKKESFNFSDTENFIYRFHKNIHDVVDFEKLPLLNELGFKWKTYRYFKKSNARGTLHSDLDSITDYGSQCEWAINWVFDGDGKIDFYKFENCILVGKTDGAQNLNIAQTPRFVPKKTTPDFSYPLLQNRAYLINTSLPHIASGLANRRVFSLRTDNRDLKWEEVIKVFQGLVKVFDSK